MNGSQTILVLGGGVGGLVAAHELRRLLPTEHRVILVDRDPQFVFAPSLLWLMTGGRTAGGISRPLARLKRKGIEVVQGEIARIDAAHREVTVSGEKLSGDYLVIALGAELAPETVPGLPAAGHNFYTVAGAEALRDALGAFTGGRLVVLTAAPAYKCPAAPYEAAMLLEHYCRSKKIRGQTQLDLYAAEPGPMGVAGPEVSKGVRQLVESKGITYHPEHQVQEVDSSARRLRFTNGAEVIYDLLAYVPPHRAPRVVREAGLVSESGWVPVDAHTMETKFEHVYALGDVVSIPLKLGKPLPKAGVFARAEAEVVARNIARAITGRGTPAAFDGLGACFVETGGGRAAYGKGNFYAEPVPDVKLHAPGWHWHIGKIWFEKNWLRRWF
jgi:sulfide:quinone oxidoreductase